MPDIRKGNKMKIGDLVRPLQACGGPLGGVRCEAALVVDKQHSWKNVEVDAYVYTEMEVDEYSLVCSCGQFEEDGNYLEMISEGR